jgi:aspartyl protease family protein
MFRMLFITMLLSGAALGFLMPATQQSGVKTDAAPVRAASVTAKASAPQEIMLERKPNGHFYVDAEVNGHFIRFVVDTGATTVALTSDDAKSAGIDFSPDKFEVVGRAAAGDLMGQRVNVNKIAVGDRSAYDVRAIVMGQGADVSLLGQNFLAKMKSIRIEGDRMYIS